LQKFPYQVYDLFTLKTSAKRAHAVVVSSKMEYEDAVAFGISREKLHVIPMGVDIPAQENRREEDAPLRILFVGRVARVRRVELILRAVQKLSLPCTVTIVGGEEKTSSLTKSGYLDELKKYCLELGIKEKVTFAGPQPPEDLPSFYNAADATMLPMCSSILPVTKIFPNPFWKPALMESRSSPRPSVSLRISSKKEKRDFWFPGNLRFWRKNWNSSVDLPNGKRWA
jgi:glycosyltransferase involved in cell wall biosynthesis